MILSDNYIILSANDKVELIDSEDDNNKDGRYLFNGKTISGFMDEDISDISKQEDDLIRGIVNNFLNKQYENMLILTGAGASIINSDSYDEKELTGYTGLTIQELTNEIKKHLKNSEKKLMKIDELAGKVNYLGKDEEINIEELLSVAESAKEFLNIEDHRFSNTLKEIEMKIKELCTLKIHEEHPHKLFLNKIISRRKSHNRVKLFTTNYDTLFEQAAQKEGIIVIDGFSYTFPRTFNSFYFDYDFIRRDESNLMNEPDYVEKVVQLYKLHGSVDWEKNQKNEIIKKENTEKPLMIYPRRDKYEQSYEAPYFEMFSRFQFELRKRNTLLITIGFSFNDKHIRTMVENALINNPDFNILIVDYDINNESFDFFKQRAINGYENIMLYETTFQGFANIYMKEEAYSEDVFSKLGEKFE